MHEHMQSPYNSALHLWRTRWKTRSATRASGGCTINQVDIVLSSTWSLMEETKKQSRCRLQGGLGYTVPKQDWRKQWGPKAETVLPLPPHSHPDRQSS